MAFKSCTSFLFPSNIFHRSNISSPLSHWFSSFVEKTPTLLNVVPKDSEILIEKYHFSQETASNLVSVSSLLKHPKRTYSGLEFLKETGFSNSQLEKIVKCDPMLVYFKGIKSKIKCFEDLGLSAVEIAAIVTNDPSILRCSAVNKIFPSLSVLKDLLGSNAQVTKFLTKPGLHMRVHLNKTLVPNVEFLKSCGVSVEQINRLLCVFMQFFLLSQENMRRCVNKVDEMGVDRSSKLFLHAVRTISSMSDTSWELKLEEFRDFGFSEDGVVRAFRSDPGVFSTSRQKMRKVKEILLETGKYDLSSIRNFPGSFRYSVEKRYKPRLQVLKDLEKKGLISKWPSLPTLAVLTDDKFRMRFATLLGNEVGKDFAGKNGFSDKMEM